MKSTLQYLIHWPSDLLIVITNASLTGNCNLSKLKGRSVGMSGIHFYRYRLYICVPSLVEIAPGVPELCWNIHTHIHPFLYTGCPRRNVPDFWEGVPYGKVYRYNPTHLCPKLNGYGDNGQRKAWSSSSSMHCSYQLTYVINVCL
jgi:hypothetical protein